MTIEKDKTQLIEYSLNKCNEMLRIYLVAEIPKLHKHLLPTPNHIIKHHSWSSGFPAASVCSKMRDSSVEVAKPGMAQVC